MAELNAIRNNSGGENYLNDHFILVRDLDFNSTAMAITGGYRSPTGGWPPIGHDPDRNTSGHQGTRFTGSFNGQGFTISNLLIFRPTEDWVGLFSRTNGGTIHNLGLDNADITAKSRVGGLVGERADSIRNCYITGSTTQESGIGTRQSIGGLVGINGTAIMNCYAAVNITGNSATDVGGLVGQNNTGGDITNCYAIGLVSGNANVGGLVGINGTAIMNCYAAVNVTGNSATDVGGLVGQNNTGGDITNCYAIGLVSGNANVGGLVGINGTAIMNCYAAVNITGNSATDVGGLVGQNNTGGDITNCYAIGLVSGNANVGGLVGSFVSSSVTNSYWDTDTGSSTSAQGGRTTTRR